ncbi:hypothetical protein BXZ70DRAFT_915975 [Cristinia sonorae]|uniref:Uncharacterized protein n=1 Tax=Cristinia sonorae TaxID=1940300 RepID=A0A8K0UXI5_9AGAR|nr:hypothetical protein BXZ70DRAFT_915975 [Cristinia sonorae]
MSFIGFKLPVPQFPSMGAFVNLQGSSIHPVASTGSITLRVASTGLTLVGHASHVFIQAVTSFVPLLLLLCAALFALKSLVSPLALVGVHLWVMSNRQLFLALLLVIVATHVALPEALAQALVDGSAFGVTPLTLFSVQLACLLVLLDVERYWLSLSTPRYRSLLKANHRNDSTSLSDETPSTRINACQVNGHHCAHCETSVPVVEVGYCDSEEGFTGPEVPYFIPKTAKGLPRHNKKLRRVRDPTGKWRSQLTSARNYRAIGSQRISSAPGCAEAKAEVLFALKDAQDEIAFLKAACETQDTRIMEVRSTLSVALEAYTNERLRGDSLLQQLGEPDTSPDQADKTPDSSPSFVNAVYEHVTTLKDCVANNSNASSEDSLEPFADGSSLFSITAFDGKPAEEQLTPSELVVQDMFRIHDANLVQLQEVSRDHDNKLAQLEDMRTRLHSQSALTNHTVALKRESIASQDAHISNLEISLSSIQKVFQVTQSYNTSLEHQLNTVQSELATLKAQALNTLQSYENLEASHEFNALEHHFLVRYLEKQFSDAQLEAKEASDALLMEEIQFNASTRDLPDRLIKADEDFAATEDCLNARRRTTQEELACSVQELAAESSTNQTLLERVTTLSSRHQTLAVYHEEITQETQGKLALLAAAQQELADLKAQVQIRAPSRAATIAAPTDTNLEELRQQLSDERCAKEVAIARSIDLDQASTQHESNQAEIQELQRQISFYRYNNDHCARANEKVLRHIAEHQKEREATQYWIGYYVERFGEPDDEEEEDGEEGEEGDQEEEYYEENAAVEEEEPESSPEPETPPSTYLFPEVVASDPDFHIFGDESDQKSGGDVY